MKSKKTLAVVIVATFVIVPFTIWQKKLTKEYENRTMSCGGDFSWQVICPIGTRCKGGGTIVGGSCKPYLDQVFSNK